MRYSISVLLVLIISFMMSCGESDPEVIIPTITLESSVTATSVGSTIIITANVADLPIDFFAVSIRISFDSNRLTISDDQSNWIGNMWSSNAIGLLEVESGTVYLSITQVSGADCKSSK